MTEWTMAQAEWDWAGVCLGEASDLLADFESRPLESLMAEAAGIRDRAFGRNITYSRKVFIPLTRLCRDTCRYCTFATTPRHAGDAYLSPDSVLEIARAGQAAGCREALFTLGDKPELRYSAARDALSALGFSSTVEYLAAMCELVLRETGLLPHVNAGVMTEDEIETLRRVSVSQGIMLETVSPRLCARGGAHFGSPDKHPKVRLEMIAAAGRKRVPFTSGILIGIGETRFERVLSFLALRRLHEEHGHLQEVIVQNFRSKPNTIMADWADPDFQDLRWTAAVARLILGATTSIQVPPNLSRADYPHLIEAGIDDWGGVSPVTPDHVNPEAPWPQITALEEATSDAGHVLVERLAVYPKYAHDAHRWQHKTVAPLVLRAIDADGLPRCSSWTVGADRAPPVQQAVSKHGTANLDSILSRAMRGTRLSEGEIVALFAARGGAVQDICSAADELRARASGDIVRYVVNRNINYTNVCTYRCQFCAFSKGRGSAALRGPAYDLDHDEIARRVIEAAARGATEVCMQGGINPHYTGQTYLDILRTVRSAVPKIHVHAFSPLEVTQGARTLGLSVAAFLERLRDAGLGSLPGTAAEILDDPVRDIICPDKIRTDEWLSVVETAHRIGLRTTATIMFGHVERPRSWARHLLALRDLQARTQGLTEFVPLPFVHMEAPIHLKGYARRGPTWREVLLMHAVARLVLHPLVTNIQASWVKLAPAGAARLLSAGVNDLGGTLMNESISRAAGTQHGQELSPAGMEALIRSVDRVPRQRTTLYGEVDADSLARSFDCMPLAMPAVTPFTARKVRKTTSEVVGERG